jgi:FAD binding domain
LGRTRLRVRSSTGAGQAPPCRSPDNPIPQSKIDGDRGGETMPYALNAPIRAVGIRAIGCSEGGSDSGLAGLAAGQAAGTNPSRRCWTRRTRAPYSATTCTSRHRSRPTHPGNVVLAGDAAHAMTPDLGQGACQALEDAVVLAKVIDSGDGLGAYDRQRRPRTQMIARRAHRIGVAAQWASPVAVGLRNTALRVLPPSSFARSLAAVLDWTA